MSISPLALPHAIPGQIQRTPIRQSVASSNNPWASSTPHGDHLNSHSRHQQRPSFPMQHRASDSVSAFAPQTTSSLNYPQQYPQQGDLNMQNVSAGGGLSDSSSGSESGGGMGTGRRNKDHHHRQSQGHVPSASGHRSQGAGVAGNLQQQQQQSEFLRGPGGSTPRSRPAGTQKRGKLHVLFGVVVPGLKFAA